MYLYGLCFPVPFSGRVRYKFASFWNRNHTLRALQRVAKNFYSMLEAEKKVGLLFILLLALHLWMKKGFLVDSFCFWVYRRRQNQHYVHIVVQSEGIEVRLRFLKILPPKLENFKLSLKKKFLLTYIMYVSFFFFYTFDC